MNLRFLLRILWVKPPPLLEVQRYLGQKSGTLTSVLPIQGVTGHQATLPQTPLAIVFTPRPRAVSPHVPPTTSAVPPYHGASYQVPPYPNVNAATQSIPYQTPPMTSAMHYAPPPLSTIPVNQDASQQASTSQLKDILGALTLGNIEMRESEKFSGEITNYHEWRVRYNGLIRNVTDAQTKLHCLLKWTIKDARRAIAKCVYIDDHEAALKEALDILEKRFGTAFKLADQKIEDIEKGKEVKLFDEASHLGFH
jgi:hypothetical protein